MSPAPMPGRLSEFLDDEALFRQVMMPESERRSPRPGRVPGEGGGGLIGPSPIQPPIGPSATRPAETRSAVSGKVLRPERPREPVPYEIDQILSAYTQGRMSAAEVQKGFKDRGWSVDLRKGRNRPDIEVYSPDGTQYFVSP